VYTWLAPPPCPIFRSWVEESQSSWVLKTIDKI
jgi:hypothetical protein